MVQSGEKDNDPGQYLGPGEKVLRYSRYVGIKKFHFNAYITDRRIFLIDRNEKKPGIISKEIPRDVVMGSHLESSGSPDPFLVLTIRTSEDETRTMKIAFIQEGDDRTSEIEEWISVLHGRALRPTKSIIRRYETQELSHKEGLIRTKPSDKQSTKQSPVHDAGDSPAQHFHGQEKRIQAEPDNLPEPGNQGNHDELPPVRKTDGPVPDVAEIAFCHHCGKRSPDSANFCPFCGTKLHRLEHSR